MNIPWSIMLTWNRTKLQEFHQVILKSPRVKAIPPTG
jgi:hypothetical protein